MRIPDPEPDPPYTLYSCEGLAGIGFVDRQTEKNMQQLGPRNKDFHFIRDRIVHVSFSDGQGFVQRQYGFVRADKKVQT
jgi:hypothetical protein